MVSGMAAMGAGISLPAGQTFSADQSSGAEANETAFDQATEIIRSFGKLPRGGRRTLDALEAVQPFGEWGSCAIFCAKDDDHAETRLLAVSCMCERTALPKFEEYLKLMPDLLDHADPAISVFGPMLLWKYGVKAKFAIPKLEHWLQHEDSVRRILAAKAIAIIDTARRTDSIAVVEAAAQDPNAEGLAAIVLDQLRGVRPYCVR